MFVRSVKTGRHCSVSIIEQLLVVQEHDTRIRDIKQELRDIPARKAQEEERLKTHQDALGRAEERVKTKQAEIKDLELEVTSKREQITKLRQQQYELKTNKEFKAMETEIQGVEKEILGLEDKELVLMEELEAARSDVKERSGELEKEKAMVVADTQSLDERAEGIGGDLKELEQKRETLAAGTDKEWLVPYERLAGRKDPAVVELKDGICGGCHMKLPPSVGHATQKQTEPVTCDYCGRILY